MSDAPQDGQTRSDAHEAKPYRVRLPGFLIEEEVGLGDLIKRATAAVGIHACGGCARRAQALNRRVRITGQRL